MFAADGGALVEVLGLSSRGGMGPLELRRIRPESVERALEKADRYRLLNEAEEAESICLDVLDVEPDNVHALRTLLLSLTDQLAKVPSAGKRARECAARLPTEYERVYYAGLVCEREAIAQLEKGMAASFAYDAFVDAIELYDQANELSPPSNDDALLRRNSCVRTIERHGLAPRLRDSELPLE